MPDRRLHKRRAQAFTLIEMLIVVMIMGLCIGLVSAVARPDDRARLRVEAERLAQLLSLAGDEARQTGKAIGWTADTSHYRFLRYNDGAWTELNDNDLLRPRALPAGMAISTLEVEQKPRPAMRLEFFPHAPPSIFFVAMTLRSESLTISESPLGDITIQAGQGISDAATAQP